MLRSILAATLGTLLVFDVLWWGGTRGLIPFLEIRPNPCSAFQYSHLYFRIDRDPAMLMGFDEEWVEQRLQTDGQLTRQVIAHVEVRTNSDRAKWLWTATRRHRSVRMTFQFWDEEVGYGEIGPKIIESLRRRTLAYIRANKLEVAARIPPTIDLTPIKDISLVATAQDSLINWPGYIHHTISLTVLGGFLWAIWPRRKPALAPVTQLK